MAQTHRDNLKDTSSVSLTLTDQLSDLSIYTESIRNSDSTALQDSNSSTLSFHTAESFDEPGTHDECQSSSPAGIMFTAPASVPPHSSQADSFGSTMPVAPYSSVETV